MKQILLVMDFLILYIERETTVTGTSKSIINGFCDLMHHK